MNERLRFSAVLVALGIGWGSTQPLGKIATSTGHGHFGLIFWQLVIGALVLGALLAVQGKRFPIRHETIRFAALIAVIGTLIPNSTFYISVAHLPSGIMSILISTVPLISFPIALALGMDRFDLRRIGGLLLGLTGVALIAIPQSSLPDPSMVAWLPVAMVGPIFYACEANIVARWGTAGLDPVQAMFGASVVGAIMAFPLMMASGQWISPLPPYGKAELALIASSTMHAGLYTTYVWLASRAGAVFASQTSYIVTGAGVTWAMLLLGERFSPWIYAAIAVMFCGLLLVRPRGRVAKVA
ncbi:MAG: DMT family transporter [Paracoccaceae bacterium]